MEELKAALDQNLFGKRVTNLNRRSLGGACGFESFGSQNRHSADSIGAGPGTEKNDQVTWVRGLGKLQVLMLHSTN